MRLLLTCVAALTIGVAKADVDRSIPGGVNLTCYGLCGNGSGDGWVVASGSVAFTVPPDCYLANVQVSLYNQAAGRIYIETYLEASGGGVINLPYFIERYGLQSYGTWTVIADVWVIHKYGSAWNYVDSSSAVFISPPSSGQE
jgi:hypothetical protein